MNPEAKAKTSSAAGLFQFVEQSWLGALQKYGAKHGFAGYANLIQKGADGRYHVPDEANRQAVLGLRYNPEIAALMAAEMAGDHAAYLQGRTGRSPSQGELYAAHVLGPAGAAELIQAAATRPQQSAASLFPQAAGANKGLFFRGGAAVSAADLYSSLTAGQNTPIAETETAAAPLDEAALKSAALAEHLNRIRNEQALLGLLLNPNSSEQAAFQRAFGPQKQT